MLLTWAIIFAVVALIAGVFGFGGLASAAGGVARVLFFIFVLKILMKITNIDVNLSALEKKAKEIEQIAHQLREMEGLSGGEKSEELRYIG